MTDRARDLLYRSLDSELTDPERTELDFALASSERCWPILPRRDFPLVSPEGWWSASRPEVALRPGSMECTKPFAARSAMWRPPRYPCAWRC